MDPQATGLASPLYLHISVSFVALEKLLHHTQSLCYNSIVAHHLVSVV